MKNTSNNLISIYRRKNAIPEAVSAKKSLEEMNMMDSFLFEAATEDIENAKKIAKVIIKRVTGRNVENLIIETQKQLKGINIDSRGIRMDVYTTENELPDIITIWILPYDPFGDDRMLYSIKNVVAENNQIVYNDGVLTIFLYTKGTNGGSKELKNLLTFMENSTSDNAVDSDLLEIQKIIGNIKSDPKTRERYMGIYGVIDYEKRDSYEEGMKTGEEIGFKEGHASGLKEGHASGLIQGTINAFKSLHLDQEHTKQHLLKEYNLTIEKAEEYLKLYW